MGRLGYTRISPARQVDLRRRADSDAGVFRHQTERRLLHQNTDPDGGEMREHCSEPGHPDRLDRMIPLRHWILSAFFFPLLVNAQTTPSAPRVEHREVRHGATVIDDYFWLRDKSSPKVTAYLESEN